MPLRQAVKERGGNGRRGSDHSLKERKKNTDGAAARSDIITIIITIITFKIRKMTTNLEIFQPEAYIHVRHPEKSQYLTVWVFLWPKTKLTPTTKTRGIMTLNRKDSCYYRNTLHTNKRRVPAGDSLGRLLGSP